MIHVDYNGLIIWFVDSEYLVYIPYNHISTKDFRRYVWIGFTYGNLRWVVATIQLLICWFSLSRIFFTANWIPSKPAKFHVHHNVIRQVIMKSSIQTYIFQLQSNLNEEHSHALFLKSVIDHKLNQIRKLTRQVSTCHYPKMARVHLYYYLPWKLHLQDSNN